MAVVAIGIASLQGRGHVKVLPAVLKGARVPPGRVLHEDRDALPTKIGRGQARVAQGWRHRLSPGCANVFDPPLT